MTLLRGDCLDKLKTLDANSVDAIVTDPPYGLSFMGKKWDYDVPSVDVWREVLRVLKPGGHLLSFGGTRTYHRMVVNIEDAGFEIRDQLQWLYGQGFPKSHDVSKAIDKGAGVEREVVAKRTKGGDIKGPNNFAAGRNEAGVTTVVEYSAPASDDAKRWQGWGTALKPANEPIVLARKPLEKGFTVAENVLKYGTGGLNIDESRIEGEPVQCQVSSTGSGFSKFDASDYTGKRVYQTQGRFPANVLFDEAAATILDEQSGTLKSGGGDKSSDKMGYHGGAKGCGPKLTERSSGGASRFFYVAKASKKERNAGLDGMPVLEKKTLNDYARPSKGRTAGKSGSEMANHHPTVKPVKLMEYLIKLVTPPGGIVLDPFMGSGTTGVAARKCGFKFIGIERENAYVQIARRRIEATA